MSKFLCPYCDNIENVTLINKKENISVRGQDIEVDSHFLRCDTCNNTFDDPKDDFDVLDVAYRKYRTMHGMLQPEEIKEWRKKLDLTQIELSRLLGFGDVTINRYEGGKLQEVSHDNSMKLSMKPQNLLSLLKGNGEAISDAQKRASILEILTNEIKIDNSFESIYEQTFGTYEPSEYSGFKKLDLRKVFSMIIFFCYGDRVYRTKLNKLLYYADFKFFKNNTYSITGLQYIKLPFGPVPDKHRFYLATLEEEHSIVLDETEYGETVTSLKEPDLNIFNNEELKILLEVKEFFKDFTAARISEFSHNEDGYINTEISAPISYKTSADLNI